MSKAEHKHNVLFGNKKAQLEVLEQELKEVTGTLSTKLVELGAATNAVESAWLQRDQVLMETAEAIRLADERIRVAGEKELKAQVASDELDKKRLLAQEETERIMREREDHAMRLSAEVTEAQEDYDRLDKACIDAIAELSLLEDTIVQKNGQLIQLTVAVRESQEQYDRDMNARTIVLEQTEKKIEELRGQMDVLTAAVEEEHEKIKAPQENLRAQEEEIKRKRADLDMYASRVKLAYEKAYPGRKLTLM